MDVSRVKYVLLNEDRKFEVEGWIDGIRIGWTWCVRDGDRLLLSDIRVQEDEPRQWPVFPTLLLRLLGERQPRQFRRRGIGSQLLKRLLREADSAGIREIRGSAVALDLDPQPTLLAWYERHGF